MSRNCSCWDWKGWSQNTGYHHRMFGDIANRKWGLSNLWIILKWRSCQRHLLSSPAHSWRWSNLAVKQLLAGKADEQTTYHPSWRTTGEWKHSHRAICTYCLISVLALTKLKTRSHCLLKWCRELMSASGVYIGGQSRMGSVEGLLLPWVHWGKNVVSIYQTKAVRRRIWRFYSN